MSRPTSSKCFRLVVAHKSHQALCFSSESLTPNVSRLLYCISASRDLENMISHIVIFYLHFRRGVSWRPSRFGTLFQSFNTLMLPSWFYILCCLTAMWFSGTYHSAFFLSADGSAENQMSVESDDSNSEPLYRVALWVTLEWGCVA